MGDQMEFLVNVEPDENEPMVGDQWVSRTVKLPKVKVKVTKVARGYVWKDNGTYVSCMQMKVFVRVYSHVSSVRKGGVK